MNIVTELEAKLHALALEVRDDIAALIKQFRSGAAVTDEQLQEAHDKLHAGITDGAPTDNAASGGASDPQTGSVDQGATLQSPAATDPAAAVTTTEQPAA